MKDAVLIAPLATVVPSVAIESAVLRVVSRDEFTFVRDSVSGNPAVRHSNVTDIMLSLYVHEQYRHIFEAVDPEIILEDEEDEDTEEEEEKPKGRRGRRAAKAEIVEATSHLLEIDCGLVHDSIVREIGVSLLTESDAYDRALEKLEKSADRIEDNAAQFETLFVRMATLQQRLQTGNLEMPATTLVSDLVPQVSEEAKKLNMEAVARQEQIMQNEIQDLRSKYDKRLDWFENKVFPKVAREESHLANPDTFRALGITDFTERKQLVALIRNNLITL